MTLKMKQQTVKHSLASDIDILKKELAILKNAREADMATMMSKEKAETQGNHPNQKPDERNEDPSVGMDRKSIKKRNINTIEIVEEKTSEPSTRDSSTESSMKAFNSHTASRFEYLSDMETNTDVEPDFIPLNHRIRRTRNIQP